MDLNAREGEREFILFEMTGEGRIGQELGGDALPSAPDLRSGEPDFVAYLQFLQFQR